ncbi:class I SAM-dependent methyltransferase [Halococcus sp. IIIV-5B]|uniref:class I SAM-dependent methyltransferase n=1 Tax=Halococcus sp. IIIV-5B TaxID=2321230 RepID=UPI000E70A5BF|nr:class I SAM-dependent methyltransferase [Halococcus sp. IIIV-5B]RJT04742.1 class I SAM-dependent methyltransferase [Halococcus sp. IIIV-5B]
MDRFQNTRQPNWDWWGELWSEPKQILSTLGISTDQSVADVGSGNGYFTLPLAELVQPAPVYAIDIDSDLLDELRRKAEQTGLSNIRCFEGDARELSSLLAEPVDTILIANTFHGVEEPTVFAEQAYQSLTPDGRLIILNWHDRPKEETPIAGQPRGPPQELRLPPTETERSISSVPFTRTNIVELPPYHYALICER